MNLWDYQLFSMASLGQLGTLFLIFILAWISQFLLGRPFKALRIRLGDIGWARQIVAVAEGALPPLIGWGLVQLSLNLFRSFNWESQLLEHIGPLISIWFLYRVVRVLFEANLSNTLAKLWTKRIVLPLTILAGILYITGLLDNLLKIQLIGGALPSITVGSILTGLVVAALIFIIARIIWRLLEESFLPEIGADPALAHAISTLTGYALIITGVIVGLAVTGVNLTTLTVIAGGLSIGLGFGLQQIISNFVSGFILMFERSIGPGDVIEIGDTLGTVQNIGIRRMIIKTPNNKEVIIPNSHFLTETMTNLTRADRIVRIDILVGVTYDCDPLEIEQALLSAAQHPSILEDPAPTVHFLDFGASSLDFGLLVWTDDPMRIPRLSSEMRYRIWDALRARNIEIPFPQHDIHIRSGPSWLESGPPWANNSTNNHRPNDES